MDISEKVLFVDDEANILEAIKRDLRKEFQIETAVGGEQGLEVIKTKGPYAVVVSDMNMDGMSGLEFLGKVREVAPDSIRMMLTGGGTDLAIRAVNEGSVFRYLTKPCSPDDLRDALRAAIEHYRLVSAERTLLSKTLTGAVKILTDILATTRPVAFGRAARVRTLVNKLARDLVPSSLWRAEVAALLSQVGCVSINEQTLTKAYAGRVLNAREQEVFDKHPIVGRDLVANVPRLEAVAEIIGYQMKRFDGFGIPSDGKSGDEIPLEARILKLAVDYDTLIQAGCTVQEALQQIDNRKGWYDPKVINSLRKIVAEEVAKKIIGERNEPAPVATAS